MPRHKGRPNERQVTIADCASVMLYDNPAPLCPHGLRWRDSDTARITVAEYVDSMCTAPACEATEYHPHDGESITIVQPRTFGGRDPLRSVYLAALAVDGGAPQPAGFVDELTQAVKDSVIAWTWTGRDGALLPLPSADWDEVARHIEYGEVLWIIEAALRGADPREEMYRPPAPVSGKDSGGG